MKKILIALAIAGFASTGAEAQTKTKACGVKDNKVCRVSPTGKGASCYKTKYASNFKVCKNENGYHVCCQAPTALNSTRTKAPVAQTTSVAAYAETDQYDATTAVATAPQSQSYPWGINSGIGASTSGSYRGYYPKAGSSRGKIKVCYVGDNVAELNKAPYQGCSTPAFDGIDKNKTKNLNVNTYTDVPPIDGRID
ncbi:MAG: hypothetical protein V4649_00730 [Bacteroidota bacterium]